LQLSRAHEFFPGTKDRVLICSGQVGQVVAALGFIFTAVDTELVPPPHPPTPLVPGHYIPLLLGKVDVHQHF